MLELLSLPDIVLEKILSYLSYDDIAKYRVICRQFDGLCKQLLNKGFLSAEKYHCQCIKSVKAQLPRRESERRSHPLARHCDILTAVETRLSMLSMTFMKYIDVGLCCFIPGKVVDEIFRILHYVKDCKTPPRAHEILQELRDISSMAMEHFDEKIVPGLRHCLVGAQVQSPYSVTTTSLISGRSNPVLTQEKVKLEFHRVHYRLKKNKTLIEKLRIKVKRQTSVLNIQSRKLRSQGSQISELKRHLEEWDHKFGDLAAELSRARDESTITESSQAICKCPTNPIAEVTQSIHKCPVGSISEEVTEVHEVPFSESFMFKESQRASKRKFVSILPLDEEEVKLSRIRMTSSNDVKE